MEWHALYKRHRSSMRIGLKLLAAVMGIELLIMLGMNAVGVNKASLLGDFADALLLGVLVSGLVYVWVVRPLKQANAHYRLFDSVVNNLPLGVVVTENKNGEQAIIAVNPAFCRITGYGADEVMGRHPRLLQGDGAGGNKPEQEQIRQAYREKRPTNVLLKNYRKDGSLFWNQLHVSPVFDHKGTVVQWVGLVDDVSEQKKLQNRTDHLAHAVQQANEGMCMFAADGRLLAANPAYCRNVQVSEADLLGQSYWQFWDADHEATAAAARAIEQGKNWQGKRVCKRADGSVFDVLSSITAETLADGEIRFSAIQQDVSNMVEMEQQLMQAQKMEAVGTLAGGIAHDFNNMLAGMLGNMYLVQRDMQDNPEALVRLKRVEKQGYQAADIIRQLLTFARAGAMEKKNFDLRPFFKETIQFARPGIPENIEVVVDVSNEKMLVNGDPVRIQQALLNLITNARHAVESKFDQAEKSAGRITLRLSECGKREGCRGECAMRGKLDVAPESCVRIEVSDNGIGMDKETMNRIFEPYFTTKEVGRGTGLGLPMVQGSVEMQGGCIDVQSEPGEGSCFSIWLPRIANEATVISPHNEEPELLTRGNGELILLADDNSDARNALKEMLEESGYEVVAAADGEQARQLFHAYQSRLYAAFLDIVMPRCNGTVVAQEIYATNPGIPVVLMTGYDIKDTLKSKDFPLQAGIKVLHKPWDCTHINDALARIALRHAEAKKRA